MEGKIMTKQIEEEINQIENKIQNLRIQKQLKIKNYLIPFGMQAIYAISDFKVKCDFKFEITRHYFDDQDETYVIHLKINDKNFHSRLDKKHKISDVVRNCIKDDFAVKRIMIMGAI